MAQIVEIFPCRKQVPIYHIVNNIVADDLAT